MSGIENISLFIPRVYVNYTEEMVKDAFEERIGSVKNVDFIIKSGKMVPPIMPHTSISMSGMIQNTLVSFKNYCATLKKRPELYMTSLGIGLFSRTRVRNTFRDSANPPLILTRSVVLLTRQTNQPNLCCPLYNLKVKSGAKL